MTIRKGQIVLPGDPGWRDNKVYPWDPVARIAGFGKQRSTDLDIAGYFVVDRRKFPETLIFKNFSMIKPAVITTAVPMKDVPEFFQYRGEAAAYIKNMHLSADDESKMAIAAMAADPGMGRPMPNVAFFHKKLEKDR